jgi:type I restriction enzyme R subunit
MMLVRNESPMSISSEGRPEDRARAHIDSLLTAAGWLIQNRNSINIEAGRGVAIREFQLARVHGLCRDYLLYIDGYAARVIQAKKAPLVELETPSSKYSQGLPEKSPGASSPAPILLPVHRSRDALHQLP